MRGWVIALPLVLWATVAGAVDNDVLVVVTDDAELSRALVEAASQQYRGPVARAPSRWSTSGEPGTVRLQVSQLDDRKWRATLSRSEVSVSRELTLPSQARRLDVAESLALALPGLMSRLSARAKSAKAHETPAEVHSEPPPAAAAEPCHCPPPVACPAPVKAEPSQPAATPADPIAPPAAPKQSPWTVAVTPGLLFSERTSTGWGAEGGVLFTPWPSGVVQLSVGGYTAHDWQYQIGLVPIDLLVGARTGWGPFSADFSAGLETTVGATSSTTSLTFAVATQVMLSMRLTESWRLGLRGIATFDPGSPSLAAPTGEASIYLPESQVRCGVVVMWTPQ